MNIVLFGKNGQLGWELERSLPLLGNLTALDREEADLCDLAAVQRALNESRPDLIINASAYTEVDQAEKEAEQAIKVNALAPGIMAEESRKLGAVFIHYSTDYVFDGRKDSPYTEKDPTNPLNTYGKSKLMGEENVRQAGDSYLILRTSWVYSLRGNSFVNKVLQWSRQNKTLNIVRDQIGNPTWARSLAEMTSLIIAQNNPDLYEHVRDKCGIYHLAGSGYTSRFEWAQHILAYDARQSEQIVESVQPARSEEFRTPALRPLFSALDCTHFDNTFGLRLPSWKRTLELAMAG
jgi:dTDP-4-dehydrorhamnose reductase